MQPDQRPDPSRISALLDSKEGESLDFKSIPYDPCCSGDIAKLVTDIQNFASAQYTGGRDENAFIVLGVVDPHDGDLSRRLVVGLTSGFSFEGASELQRSQARRAQYCWADEVGARGFLHKTLEERWSKPPDVQYWVCSSGPGHGHEVIGLIEIRPQSTCPVLGEPFGPMARVGNKNGGRPDVIAERWERMHHELRNTGAQAIATLVIAVVLYIIMQAVLGGYIRDLRDAMIDLAPSRYANLFHFYGLYALAIVGNVMLLQLTRRWRVRLEEKLKTTLVHIWKAVAVALACWVIGLVADTLTFLL